MKNNFQIHLHCIGDKATTMIINAIKNSKKNKECEENKERHYIAHLQLIRDIDIEEMDKLKIKSQRIGCL